MLRYSVTRPTAAHAGELVLFENFFEELKAKVRN